MTTLIRPHHGQAVAVADPAGTWEGVITAIGLFDTSPVMVAVTDPPGDGHLLRGQRVIVSPRDLVPVFKPDRWS